MAVHEAVADHPNALSRASSRLVRALSRKTLTRGRSSRAKKKLGTGAGQGAACDAVQERVAIAAARRQDGESATNLKAEGFSCKTLQEAGFEWRTLFEAGFEKSHLMQAGFTLTRLGAEGCERLQISGQLLKHAGYSDLLLARAGFTKERLEKEALAAAAQQKAETARAKVAELQAQQAMHLTKRGEVTEEERRKMGRGELSEEERRRMEMAADAERLEAIKAELLEAQATGASADPVPETEAASRVQSAAGTAILSRRLFNRLLRSPSSKRTRIEL